MLNYVMSVYFTVESTWVLVSTAVPKWLGVPDVYMK